MENEHVLSGLIRKRAEIAGQLEHEQSRVRQLIIDVDNVDATIRLFAPDIDLDEIRPKPVPPRHTAFHGEISRIILNTMRETGLALTTRDITIRVMQERGMNVADPGCSVRCRSGLALACATCGPGARFGLRVGAGAIYGGVWRSKISLLS